MKYLATFSKSSIKMKFQYGKLFFQRFVCHGTLLSTYKNIKINIVCSLLHLVFLNFSEVPLIIPSTEVTPASWWDAEADKSLVIGTYRYGYEQ